MRGLGKLLQLIALIALPMAIIMQFQDILSLSNMLKLMVAGFAAFWIGRIIEGYSTPREEFAKNSERRREPHRQRR